MAGKFRKSQTGTPSKRNYGGKKVAKKIVNPWGSIFPQKGVGRVNGIGQSRRSARNTVSGSDIRKPTPDSSERGMQYPANKPYAWPVEPDFDTHVAPENGHTSGYTAAVAARQNAQVNTAFKRGGYAG